jgi:hypothetical protein
MFAGMFFLTLGAGGSYLGFIRREAATAAVPAPRTTSEVQLPQLAESR